jgi:hypothetical protein
VKKKVDVMKNIPIKAAKDVAKTYDADIVCIVAWDANTGRQHVTTFGRTIQECEWAALLGNSIKRRVLNWPEEQCNAKPARLK